MPLKVKLTGEIVVSYADKAFGQGHFEMKCVDQHGNLRIYEGHQLL